MKHIKLRGTFLPHLESVRITVLEQTHFKDNFGINYGIDDGQFYDTSDSFIHESVRLISNASPARTYVPSSIYDDGRKDGNSITLWFLLAGRRFEDNHDPEKPIIVSVKDWERIKSAVKAYNEWGAKQP